jgi:hypothetical protein
MKRAKCLACKKMIKLQEDIKAQELITCPYCKSILELMGLNPPTLDWPDDPVVRPSRGILSKMY